MLGSLFTSVSHHLLTLSLDTFLGVLVILLPILEHRVCYTFSVIPPEVEYPPSLVVWFDDVRSSLMGVKPEFGVVDLPTDAETGGRCLQRGFPLG
jgi:hypothetical protein